MMPEKPINKKAQQIQKILLIFICLGSFIGLGITWALASPLGGSPDDDYHLASTWCPTPLDKSGCVIREDTETGKIAALVPQPIAKNDKCFAFRSNVSAACTYKYSAEKDEWTYRVDDGNYPGGYYKFHHLFISDNLITSIILMRIINFLIGIILYGIILALLPSELRLKSALALLVAWTPMGIYFIASNNPSSWAILGISAFFLSMLGAVENTGKNRYLLLVCAAVGAALACASRGDAAFYLLVAGLAIGVYAFRSTHWKTTISIAGLASLVGLFVFRNTGHSVNITHVATSGAIENSSTIATPPLNRIISLLLSFPEYFAGFWGAGFGAGWFDAPMRTAVFLGAFTALGIFLSLALGKSSLKKILMLCIVGGAVVGIPVVAAYTQGNMQTYTMQPRYLLPLLPPLLIVLALNKKFISGSGKQKSLWLLISCLSLANMYALHSVLGRFTGGADRDKYNLNKLLSWWWDIPASPMLVWAAGSLLFFCACASLLLLLSRLDTPAPASISQKIEPE